jgi:hypothetical protein
MFCLDCARDLDECGNVQEDTPPRPCRKRARDVSSAGCNCAYAITSLMKYTLKLLRMCAPEALQPLAAVNLSALIAEDFCSVILPNLHEVERIVLQPSETGSGSCSSCSRASSSSSSSPSSSL